MGKPYSMDLRERVVAAIEDGESTHQAAARFAIGTGAWARLKRSTGDVRPAKQGKPKGAVLDAHADFILGVLAEAPDTTLDEMVERLRQERGVTKFSLHIGRPRPLRRSLRKDRPNRPLAVLASLRSEQLQTLHQKRSCPKNVPFQQRACSFGIAGDAKIKDFPVFFLRLVEVVRLLPSKAQIAFKIHPQVANHGKRSLFPGRRVKRFVKARV
jgi:transposase